MAHLLHSATPLEAALAESRGKEHASLHRRTLLKLAAMGGACWLTRVADVLARQAEAGDTHAPATSLIVVWLAGGPSQLETFDPHAGKKIGGDTKAIDTTVKGIQLADGLERLAEQMKSISLVRSLVSKEGDHERGTYFLKTGYRPDSAAVYPAIGAILCHERPDGACDLPQHISILPNQYPGRGGFLGDQFDAFKTGDPNGRIPDLDTHTSIPRMRQRLTDLDVLERGFAQGREQSVEATQHQGTIGSARKMMSSDQVQAFDVRDESVALRASFGETPFGRGCLAARRLIEVGVRCVEVTLSGWDSHVNNHSIQASQKKIMDPALAALIADLQERGTWEKTVLLVAGEFGRTPTINPLEGRDHWPSGFSVVIGGGRIRGGQVIGQTDPEGTRKVDQPKQVADIHATLLAALGINPAKELISPAGRPLKLAEGAPILELLL